MTGHQLMSTQTWTYSSTTQTRTCTHCEYNDTNEEEYYNTERQEDDED